MVVEPLRARTGNEPVPVATRTITIADRAEQTLPRFVLPPGTNIEGLVIGPSGAPEIGARLELFVLLQGQPVRIGVTQTDRRGLFTVVVESR